MKSLSLLKRQLQTLTIASALLLSLVSNVFANQLTIAVKVSPVGDAQYDVNWPLNETYADIKASTNPLYLARTLNDASAWHGVDEMEGEFNDASQAFLARMEQKGYARVTDPGEWEIDMAGTSFSLITIADGVAHFSSAMAADGEAMNVIVRVALPEGSENIRYDEAAERLTYEFEPVESDGTNGDVEVVLNTRDRVMSALAKVYGDENFDSFWVARTRVENTGDQIIHDLKIRHRVAGLSSWSSWKRHEIVYPNQTVIEPFFPVFDIDELANFTDTRTAMVEVEYQYEMGGKEYSDSDSHKLKILARNQALWASRPPEDRFDWTDQFDNSPMVISAFCNSNDPVVQEIAGAVSRMTGGQPQTSDEGACEFLRHFWYFLEINRVAYQSPAVGADAFDRNLQHLKYPRDVMRNRAGTCVDLAILWASVARAVGLQAYVLVIPGHAFPVVQLPSGELLPIESTYILHASFEDAVNRGVLNFKIANGQITTDQDGNALPNVGKVIDIDVTAMQSAGIHCLDLPPVDENYLGRLGYEIELTEENVALIIRPRGQEADIEETQDELNQYEQRLVGKWQVADTGYGMILEATRKLTILVEGEDPLVGTWSCDSQTVRSSFGDELPYTLLGADRIQLIIDETELELDRINGKSKRKAAKGSKVLGMWGFNGTVQGVVIKGVQKFYADGTYECAVLTIQNGVESVTKEQGTYKDHGSYFYFDTNQGQYNQAYRWSNGDLSMEFADLGTWLVFKRIDE